MPAREMEGVLGQIVFVERPWDVAEFIADDPADVFYGHAANGDRLCFRMIPGLA